MTERQMDVIRRFARDYLLTGTFHWLRATGSGERVTLASLYRHGVLARRARRGVEGAADAAYEYRVHPGHQDLFTAVSPLPPSRCPMPTKKPKKPKHVPGRDGHKQGCTCASCDAFTVPPIGASPDPAISEVAAAAWRERMAQKAPGTEHERLLKLLGAFAMQRAQLVETVREYLRASAGMVDAERCRVRQCGALACYSAMHDLSEPVKQGTPLGGATIAMVCAEHRPKERCWNVSDLPVAPLVRAVAEFDAEQKSWLSSEELATLMAARPKASAR